MLYQAETGPQRPGAATPEAPKIWGTGAYNTIIFGGTTARLHDDLCIIVGNSYTYIYIYQISN